MKNAEAKIRDNMSSARRKGGAGADSDDDDEAEDDDDDDVALKDRAKAQKAVAQAKITSRT